MGEYDFAVTRNQVIESALEAIGVLGMGQNPTIEQNTRANRELNMLLKSMDFGNALSWRTTDTSLTTVIGQAEYDAPAGVIGLLRPIIRINDIDSPIGLMSYPDYFSSISDKTAAGQPTHITFKENLAGNKIYLWPVPTEIQTIRLLAVYEIKDMDNPSDINLFPKAWAQTVIWKLASILCYHYNSDVNTRAQIENKAEELYQKSRIDNFVTKIGAEVYFEPY